jgi:hypothetical protein
MSVKEKEEEGTVRGWFFNGIFLYKMRRLLVIPAKK